MWTHSWKGAGLGILIALGVYTGVQFLQTKSSQNTTDDIALPEHLNADERNTIRLFETVAPSVVSITAMSVERNFLSMNYTAIPQGSGSGFVWDAAGHIVTNLHVVGRADVVRVTLQDQRVVEAKILGSARTLDLAVLKVNLPDDAEMPPITLANSADLRVGQQVLAIGNPFGLDHSLSTGVVSALGRSIESLGSTEIHNVIQTDAAINPGNSGGPLLNSAGQIIGINTAIRSPSGASAGVGFAVPIDTVKRAVPDLIQYGRLRRPSLGIQAGSRWLARRVGTEGIPIVAVYEGGPASRAGLSGIARTQSGRMVLGDVIEGVAGNPVSTHDDLFAALSSYSPGDMVVMQVRSGAGKRSVRVQLGPYLD